MKRIVTVAAVCVAIGATSAQSQELQPTMSAQQVTDAMNPNESHIVVPIMMMIMLVLVAGSGAANAGGGAPAPVLP